MAPTQAPMFLPRPSMPLQTIGGMAPPQSYDLPLQSYGLVGGQWVNGGMAPPQTQVQPPRSLGVVGGQWASGSMDPPHIQVQPLPSLDFIGGQLATGGMAPPQFHMLPTQPCGLMAPPRQLLLQSSPQLFGAADVQWCSSSSSSIPPTTPSFCPFGVAVHGSNGGVAPCAPQFWQPTHHGNVAGGGGGNTGIIVEHMALDMLSLLSQRHELARLGPSVNSLAIDMVGQGDCPLVGGMFDELDMPPMDVADLPLRGPPRLEQPVTQTAVVLSNLHKHKQPVPWCTSWMRASEAYTEYAGPVPAGLIPLKQKELSGIAWRGSSHKQAWSERWVCFNQCLCVLILIQPDHVCMLEYVRICYHAFKFIVCEVVFLGCYC